jgi:hypothetical protein
LITLIFLPKPNAVSQFIDLWIALMQREVSIMSEPLVTYLHDHLGGAQVAIQLLEGMRDQHDDPTFRDFASALLPEIQADDAMLRSIAEKIGASPSVIKQAGGWLVEKFARVNWATLARQISRCSSRWNFLLSAYMGN